MRHDARSIGGLLGLLLLAGCERAAVERSAPSASGPPPAAAPPQAAPPSSLAPASAPPASAQAPPDASVTVDNIGMHIGGGPNDAVTKAPIAASVAPHLGELRACWGQVADPSRAGDFGVDLLIPAAGGRAAVSHPRTRLGPDAFRDCVVAVFAGIDFAQPRTGRTTVSYALRFTPAVAR